MARILTDCSLVSCNALLAVVPGLHHASPVAGANGVKLRLITLSLPRIASRGHYYKVCWNWRRTENRNGSEESYSSVLPASAGQTQRIEREQIGRELPVPVLRDYGRKVKLRSV